MPWHPRLVGALNCVVTYKSSQPAPVADGNVFQIAAPYELPSLFRSVGGLWESTRGSNVVIPSESMSNFPFDSSLEAVQLPNAVFQSVSGVMQSVAKSPISIDSQVESVLMAFEKFLTPPEVRLILPTGSFALQHTNAPLLSRVFPSLFVSSKEQSPVEQTLGNTPDALLVAAEYLRSIPLLEVEYIPVNVLVPSVSSVEIVARNDAWKTWLVEAENLAARTGTPIPVGLRDRVRENIATMESYIALEETLRNYRLWFPQELDALLSVVERVNAFFRESWVEENAQRLEMWHAMYAEFLPMFREESRALQSVAADIVRDCHLVSSCRMNAFPVRADANPEEIRKSLDIDLAPFLDSTYWLDSQERSVSIFSDQIPSLTDVTLDLSSVSVHEPIRVPILTVEPSQLSLPEPPSIDVRTFNETLNTLSLPELPRLRPPLFAFPSFTLPDPKTSLFLVPNPPKINITAFHSLLQSMRSRLDLLRNICDTSGAGTSFLVNEDELLSGHSNPVAVRAMVMIPGAGRKTTTPSPTLSWDWLRDIRRWDKKDVETFAWPFTCPECGSLRTERMITQHIQLNLAWEDLQQTLLKAIDIWNADVRFTSVVPRDELVREYPGFAPHSGLSDSLFPEGNQ